MKRNQTMMQFFEWHIEADGSHWNRLRDITPELKAAGITTIWIPPVTKALSSNDTGYGVYDLYDLGEFDQKGAIRTKYGTKQELINAIVSCHEQGLLVYVDLVMNHKAGADEKETFQVIEVAGNNRTQDISKPFDIEGWTKFTFPGRGNQYSSFKWNYDHFNGTDYDARNNRSGVFRIIGENKHWNEHVAHEFGNYDYLMFADIDYNHPQVREEMISWGKWLTSTLSCNGYRLDAIKHINHDFIKEFAKAMVHEHGEDFYIVGEFWNSNLSECQQFLNTIDYTMDLFDVSLHYKLQAASHGGKSYNLATIFDDTLVHSHPMNAVTFVDNHDSQPHESLESWVQDWFKQSAYALILLRKDGFPVVFYGDYYGIGGKEPLQGKRMAIDPLLYTRYHKAYGEQQDYFDHPNTIGWVRRGIPEIAGSGCAVVISNSDQGEKRMYVGEHHAGAKWIDYTQNRKDEITIAQDGFATFPVMGGSVSVWAGPKESHG
ncbi:alpha-amylase [Paenibacillus crassostreae]|uniref:Alpha-amylase n=1 Tax=Paenibacillus crassostreae TaxID=1763538 RepID=A0A167B8D5_9BACL|nr:alpha-amylase [Paenibacillus crassostreae]AOZ93080.1 alpha-amylase [Paenibacillus crassostreae]OAB71831.1 alpha-amylase [Paenibacillus crassostreae]